MAAPAFLPIALGVGVLLIASSASAKDKKPPAPGGVPIPPIPPMPGTPGGVPIPPIPPLPGTPGGVPIPPIPPGTVPGGFPVPGGGPLPAGCTLDAHLPESHKQATMGMLATKSIPGPQLVAAAQIAEVNGFPLTARCLRDEAARRGGGTSPPPGFDPFNPLTWPNALPGGFPGMPSTPPPGQPGQPPPPPGGPPPPPPPPGGPTPPGQPGAPPGSIPLPGGGSIPIPPGFPVPPGIPGAPNIGAMPFVIRMGDRPYGLAMYYTGDGGRFRELEALNPQLGDLQTGPPPYPGWLVGKDILIPPSWDPWNKPAPPTGL